MVVFINELGQTLEMALSEEQTKIQIRAFRKRYESLKTWENPPEDWIQWSNWRIATEEDLLNAKEKGYKKLL